MTTMTTVYIFFHLAALLCARPCVADVVVAETHDAAHTYNHATLDITTGHIFAGAKNRLYEFDADLSTLHEVTTGPKLDNVECAGQGACDEGKNKQLLDNFNKVLVIDYDRERVIVCGSLFQGVCEVRQQRNLSAVLYPRPGDTWKYLAANNETASTVAFLAPWHPNPEKNKVLVVGTSYTSFLIDNKLETPDYRGLVPAVSSRSLNDSNLFDFAYQSQFTKTSVSIPNKNLQSLYPIRYVYGFSSQGFSYILTVQRRDVDLQPTNPYISKVVRICDEDRKYYSFTEVPMSCGDYNLLQAAHVGRAGRHLAASFDAHYALNGSVTPRDDVLFAVFSRSRAAGGERETSVATEQSALCVYPLKYVRRVFMENTQSCFNGEFQAIGWIYGSPDAIPHCTSSGIPINDNYCGREDINIHLAGQIPIEGSPLLEYSNSHLTAVIAGQVHDITVAFLGTADGRLKKVTVDSATVANEFEELIVDVGSPVNPDLNFDLDEEHVYVMTKHKLSKVKVKDCDMYRTCQECLGAKDPYCGWCSLENKCSPSVECSTGSDPLHWVMYRDGHCSVITKVYPSQLQVTLATTLDISIEHFPRLEGQFMCVFTAHGVSLSSPANKTSTGVTCRTPPTTQVVSIPVGMQYYIAKLSVQVSGSPNFVTTDFIFYNCVRFSSCTACTNSSFACDWCRTNHRCTHDTGTYCRDDHIITGLNTPGPSIRPGPDHCPRINSTRPEFLIPSGTEYQIAVHASNVEEIDPSPFQCEFNLDGRISDVEAVYEDGFIKCNYHLFKYDSPAKSIEAQFAILWGGTRALDNPNNIIITVYRCEEMAKQCGFCLTLDQRYRCGWCGGACTIAEMCGTGEWLSNGAICPNPTIEKFSPRMGPYEGGTNITISGYNLGLNYDDIKSGVTVAGQICMPYEELYVRTKQIVCKAGESSKGNKGYLQVMVRGDSRYIGVSDMEFAYVDPKINKTWPKVGPKSGGTKITITGRHMDAGSHITAFIVWDEPTGQTRSPCEVIRTSHKEVDCLTSASSKATPGRIVMRFDSAERHSTETFTYHDDPVILDVLPSGGIPSGGNDIYVLGLNLNVVQDPQMFVSLDGKEFIGRCDGLNSSLMVCKSPIIMSTSVPGPNDPPSLLDYGFNMDNVTRLRNIPSLPNFSKFTLYPDPVVYNFTEKNQVKRYKSDYLAISIRNLCEVCSMQEFFEVRIGSEYCNVTSVAPNLLNCQPPGAQPTSRADGADPKSLPEVTVVIGNSREFLIGYLQYETESGRLPLWGIIAIAVAAGILLFIVFVILIAYRHQSSKSERVLKNMQEQMDVLELRVAAECKEAFAELQTDMTFLTGDISGYGIPFMDYKYYSLKVLFPNQDDHPVLRELDVDPRKRKSVEKALRQFGHLIMNKTFLLLFIGTLESNKYFSMKDRVNVASLIMVALQSKMEYCTDILKTLLADLIEKSIVGNSHPKLLLRRTESVAEKMLTAWFTFLLYRFLRECAGEPLFLLYMAIQQQIEKGPVDAVTNEAKYSLSEEKLIRQQIDYRQMTVYVSGLDPSNENQETPVKVLNCDTISEVKEKALNAIYKSTPYSLRPTKNDLDLEWRTGVSGRLVLQDDDISTKPEGEWKRLNTLAHYKVPDGASLALVPKQSSIFNLSMSLLSDRSDHSHRHGAYLAENSSVHTASQPLSRAMSPMDHHHTLESGIKYWHLIKPMDSNNEREGERSSKLVSEIYLTRLLATKGTLQKFVDDLFETIFSTHQRGNALPLAIKYMFDFLDDQALLHGITDPEVVHTWKSNSLPLRFWVNLIKNPNFVFDIHKSTIQDACLSVIAQTFMDACSTSEHRLGKDSPASKLLYAKDIPTYKEWVEKYYQDIKLMAAISDQDMNAMLAEESRTHVEEFNVNVSLFELYGYACKYNDQLMQTLQDDEFSRKNRLAYKLEQVHNAIAETDA